MVNLSRVPLAPRARTAGERLDQLEAEVKFLRSSRALVGRAEFPAGVIPPTALKVATAQPGLVNLTQTGFALGTSAADLVTATITVPPGFTGCAVNLLGRVYAANPTASTGFLSAQTKIAGVAGNAIPVRVVAAAAGVNPAPLATLLTGLFPGSTFSVAVSGWADAAWSANPSNLVDLTGSIVWVP
jgi:hypothetical protein